MADELASTLTVALQDFWPEAFLFVFGTCGWLWTGMPFLIAIAVLSGVYIIFQLACQSEKDARASLGAWMLYSTRQCVSCFQITITIAGVIWVWNQLAMADSISDEQYAAMDAASKEPGWSDRYEEIFDDIKKELNTTNITRAVHKEFLSERTANFVSSLDFFGGLLMILSIPCPALLIKFGLEQACDQLQDNWKTLIGSWLAPGTIALTTAWALFYATFGVTGCNGGCWLFLMIIIFSVGAISVLSARRFLQYRRSTYPGPIGEDNGIPTPGSVAKRVIGV